MARLWCAPCARELRPVKTGDRIVTHIRGDDREGGEPYELIAADRWGCPGCGAEVFYTAGASPIAHAHEPDFEDRTGNATPVRYHECASREDQ